jgi:hypothetical protein
MKLSAISSQLSACTAAESTDVAGASEMELKADG